MTYPALSAVFVVVAVVAALVLGRGAATGVPRRTSFAAAGAAAAALIVLTAVFDNVMIAAGLFAYDDAHISGIRIGEAPIEDLAYPVAAVILLPAIWSRLHRPDERPDAEDRRDP